MSTRKVMAKYKAKKLANAHFKKNGVTMLLMRNSYKSNIPTES